MENNINISFLNEQFTYMNMLVSDEIYKGSFSLADIHNLPEVPDIVEPKAYELSINIDKTFKDQYLKAYRALGSTNRFTIQSDGNIKFTLGNKESYANKVSFEKESDESLPLTPKSFSGEAVAAILKNNDCENARMEVSEEGLMKIYIQENKSSVTYYIVELEDL